VGMILKVELVVERRVTNMALNLIAAPNVLHVFRLKCFAKSVELKNP
jgi:hypothetical protein